MIQMFQSSNLAFSKKKNILIQLITQQDIKFMAKNCYVLYYNYY